MILDEKSEARLLSVHPDLARVVRAAARETLLSFIVTEGVRTLEKQKALVAAGASRTMRSRHLPNADGLACAVDLAALVAGQARWDWPLYDQLAMTMKDAAGREGVALEWGGDWVSFRDGCHFQLPWEHYP